MNRVQVKMIGRWEKGEPKKCVLCIGLKKHLREALDELGLSDMEIEECQSQEEYDSYGVFTAPLLIINGKVKLSGRVPPKEMLKEFLKFELTEVQDENK